MKTAMAVSLNKKLLKALETLYIFGPRGAEGPRAQALGPGGPQGLPAGLTWIPAQASKNICASYKLDSKHLLSTLIAMQ